MTWPRTSYTDSPISEGNLVINSLERFKEANGRYPQDLEELSDHGLPVPPPVWKNVLFRWESDRWEYKTVDGGFELLVGFEELHYPVCYFESARNKWVIDD